VADPIEVLHTISARLDAATAARIEQIFGLVTAINQRTLKMAATLDDLVAAVAAENTVIDSAITLLNGVSAQLAAAIAANDPAKIQAVLDNVNAEKAKLAAAVAANTGTPAPAPAPAPTPAPAPGPVAS